MNPSTAKLTVPLSPASSIERVSGTKEASPSSGVQPNPLWVITAALALFFSVAAAFLAAG
jgi:hypothetical protein